MVNNINKKKRRATRKMQIYRALNAKFVFATSKFSTKTHQTKFIAAQPRSKIGEQQQSKKNRSKTKLKPTIND